MATLEKALLIAITAHQGQVDKADTPYILHPLRVMLHLFDREEQIVAVLHDVVEDSGYTLDHLREEGFSDDIIAAVDAVTARSFESYDEFIFRASENRIGRHVKMADLEDNLNVHRLSNLTEADLVRMNKYKKALAFLSYIENSDDQKEAAIDLRAHELAWHLDLWCANTMQDLLKHPWAAEEVDADNLLNFCYCLHAYCLVISGKILREHFDEYFFHLYMKPLFIHAHNILYETITGPPRVEVPVFGTYDVVCDKESFSKGFIAAFREHQSRYAFLPFTSTQEKAFESSCFTHEFAGIVKDLFGDNMRFYHWAKLTGSSYYELLSRWVKRYVEDKTIYDPEYFS